MHAWKRFAVVVTVIAAGLQLAGCASTAQGSYPSKPIEYIVSSGAGGGNDIIARTLGEISGQHKLLPVPITVVNKPGGSSGVAKAYLAEHDGDPHYWLTTATSFQTSTIRGQTPLGYKDVTPLVLLVEDSFVLAVKSDSRFNSMKDLIEEAKKNPKKVTWAGGAVGNDDHILMYYTQKATGAVFNYVSHDSASEAIAALLGGHVAMSCSNVQDIAGQIEAKQVKVLAAAGDKRLPSMPDIPTLKEQGIDVSHAQFRGIVGAKNMPKDSVKYLDEFFKKLAATDEWKKYLKANDLVDKLMLSEEYGKFLAADYDRYDEAITGLGLKKK